MYETFEGEKFCELVGKNFMEKTFADCSLVAPKDTERKLSQIATKSQNS